MDGDCHHCGEVLKDEFDSFGTEVPWPDDVILYEPHEKQSLLYEFADCISVRALLTMCELPFSIQMRPNTEHMSPSGEVPLLRAGNLCVGGFGTILSFVESKGGICQSDALSPVERADMMAAMALVSTHLKNAEVKKEVSKVCDALSEKLGDKKYFCFDDRPTELDALAFGHLFTILTTELPGGPEVDLASNVKSYKNLLEFCQRIERQYFTRKKKRTT